MARRLGVLLLLVLVSFSFLLARLFWVQLVWGGQLRSEAAKIRSREVIIHPRRGNIYDRQHNLLVSSKPAYSLYANPREIKNPQEAAERVAAVLGLPGEEVVKKLSVPGFFVWIAHGVDYDKAQQLRELEGFGLVDSSSRFYHQGTMAAALLGFVGSEGQGLNGLEMSYEKELQGVPGKMLVEVDAQGRVIPQSSRLVQPARAGNNLILTLDQTIQYYVERELDRLVSEHQPKWATILVMDPRTGEVLAMGSRPTFDPSRWPEFPREVWEKNPATHYTYEPGSTFKVVVAAAALEEGVVRVDEGFEDNGYITVSGRKIYCWNRQGHGFETFAQAVENSCNPVFVQVGQRLGRERLYRYTRGFGFGSPTGIDLPGEEVGLLIPQQQARELDIASMAIGQALAVTPLQQLCALAAIANGGYLLRPYLVKAVENEKGEIIWARTPQSVRQVISSSTARQVAGLLEKVVLEGTGQLAKVEGYRVAGKTGTAQVPGPGGYLQGRYVASFAGFAPLEEPRIAVLVVVGEPGKGQYHGGEVAAPVFSAVVRDTLRYLGIPESPEGSPRESVPAAEKTGQLTVPNVVGYPVEEARWLLGERGLKSWAGQSSGVVVGQDPPPGRNVPPGTVVSLRVASSRVQDVIMVPDLAGLTVKKAGAVLEKLGLGFSPLGSGIAVSQEPSPGSLVKPGTAVKVKFNPP